MNPNTWRIVQDIGTLVLIVAAGCAFAWRCLRKSAEPGSLIVKWIISAGVIGAQILIFPHVSPTFLLAFLILPPVLVVMLWVPSIGSMMANLVTTAIDGGDVPMDAQPLYSAAETKRRNGHPQEAMALVREQLEEFPGDFPGVMLLASILAEDLNDLPGAQLALERWMEGPAATPQGKASALTTLADWHLQFAQDPEAARAALERIVKEFPDTPISHQTAQRLAHLPTVEYLMAAGKAATVNLRPGEKDLGLRKNYTGPVAAEPDWDALAEECVKQLEKHPADTATREKLAVLYAEHFHRLDLATDQLEQLIAFPNETPRHIVEWLNLLADLQIRIGKDLAGAEATLRRIAERFPHLAQAELALARLASLQGEMKGGHTAQVKTMGRYEKDLGLKKTAG